LTNNLQADQEPILTRIGPNEYTLDRDGRRFSYVVNFFRGGGIYYNENDSHDVSLREIYEELDFLEIPREVVYRVEKGKTPGKAELMFK